MEYMLKEVLEINGMGGCLCIIPPDHPAEEDTLGTMELFIPKYYTDTTNIPCKTHFLAYMNFFCAMAKAIGLEEQEVSLYKKLTSVYTEFRKRADKENLDWNSFKLSAQHPAVDHSRFIHIELGLVTIDEEILNFESKCKVDLGLYQFSPTDAKLIEGTQLAWRNYAN